jgi:hypothetical protein
MKNHNLWMVLGCGLPLLLIFIAPAIGLGENISLFIFIIFMFACHLMMPMSHRKHDTANHTKTNQTGNNESN